ncbi:glycerophosphodiester phosphodiesterase [Nocardioides anomalus]|uniref:Glycerophosphodiester phosphodiesterase n=1 Tax=Nocardioides anomalus TaxID=2712223 RepID=A0A6G6WCU4_9ACTN|nr:glycerophosphodiester phosphodiesterase [Nocardioides anomalus]QIG43148.1 glycerophosphodiester phosphodiesterase [Nocardioides anomalus]
MSRVLVSAHRMGAGGDRTRENSLEALEASLALGVDYVEFDVWPRGDGTFVVAHDPEHDRGLAYGAVLDAVRGRARGHVDLKVRTREDAVAAARQAVAVLGAEALVVTMGGAGCVRAVRDWADAEGLTLAVGLSLGRARELFPHRKVRRSRANVVVAHHTLARLGLAAFARRRGLPLLVWTVDTEDSLRYWLRPGRAWLVTTNHPGLALSLRG